MHFKILSEKESIDCHGVPGGKKMFKDLSFKTTFQKQNHFICVHGDSSDWAGGTISSHTRETARGEPGTGHPLRAWPGTHCVLPRFGRWASSHLVAHAPCAPLTRRRVPETPLEKRNRGAQVSYENLRCHVASDPSKDHRRQGAGSHVTRSLRFLPSSASKTDASFPLHLRQKIRPK